MGVVVIKKGGMKTEPANGVQSVAPPEKAADPQNNEGDLVDNSGGTPLNAGAEDDLPWGGDSVPSPAVPEPEQAPKVADKAPAKAAGKKAGGAGKKSAQGNVTTSKTGALGVEEETHQPVPVTLDAVPLATVTVSGGATLNMGDYNSVRLFVGVTLPCEPEKIDETFETARSWVDERLNAMVAEAHQTN